MKMVQIQANFPFNPIRPWDEKAKNQTNQFINQKKKCNRPQFSVVLLGKWIYSVTFIIVPYKKISFHSLWAIDSNVYLIIMCVVLNWQCSTTTKTNFRSLFAMCELFCRQDENRCDDDDCWIIHKSSFHFSLTSNWCLPFSIDVCRLWRHLFLSLSLSLVFGLSQSPRHRRMVAFNHLCLVFFPSTF